MNRTLLPEQGQASSPSGRAALAPAASANLAANQLEDATGKPRFGKEDEAKALLAKIAEAEPAEALAAVPPAAHQAVLADLERVKSELRISQEEAQQANHRKTELATQLKEANREMAEMMHANFGLKDKLAQREGTLAAGVPARVIRSLEREEDGSSAR